MRVHMVSRSGSPQRTIDEFRTILRQQDVPVTEWEVTPGDDGRLKLSFFTTADADLVARCAMGTCDASFTKSATFHDDPQPPRAA